MTTTGEYLPNSDEVNQQLEDDAIISQLACLTDLEYERVRGEKAKQLGIGRIGMLDKLVKEKRKELASTATVDEAIWKDPVDGATLLGEIKLTLERYCYLPRHAADVLAVWTLQTYCFRQFEFCGVIAIWSAEPACGKGRVLDTLAEVVNTSFRTANTSAAVLYHTIEDKGPTLLIDELDSQKEEQQEAIGNVLKSGFQCNGTAHRMAEIGGQQTVVEFKTFGPKAVATIGLKSLDKASRTRAISIHMQRKPRTIKVEKFRRVNCQDIRAKCRRWVKDHLESIRSHPPIDVEQAANDRQEDVWEPLVILARHAGEDWEQKVREAARAMSGEAVEQGGESLGHRVLFAIKTMFDEGDLDRASSKAICDYLEAFESEGFSDVRNGKGMNPHFLAQLLTPYSISSSAVRLKDGKILKGYLRSQFEEAWESYVATVPTVSEADCDVLKGNKVTSPVVIDQNSVLGKVTEGSCYLSETTTSINAGADCNDVTFLNQENACVAGIAVNTTEEEVL